MHMRQHVILDHGLGSRGLERCVLPRVARTERCSDSDSCSSRTISRQQRNVAVRAEDQASRRTLLLILAVEHPKI